VPHVEGSGRRARHRRGRVLLAHIDHSFTHLGDGVGKVASRIAIESDVCGYDYNGGCNVGNAVVRSLRKKLADQAALIETVHGTGYRLRRR
jgi:DNA-binding response OmpR family regulator